MSSTRINTILGFSGRVQRGADLGERMALFAVPFDLALVLHRFIMRRGKTEMAWIDNALGFLAIVSILALSLGRFDFYRSYFKGNGR